MKKKKSLLLSNTLTIGQDNPKRGCIVGDVSTIFNGVLDYHGGPYDGITIECKPIGNVHRDSFIYHIFYFFIYFIFIFSVAYSPIVVNYFLLEKS